MLDASRTEPGRELAEPRAPPAVVDRMRNGAGTEGSDVGARVRSYCTLARIVRFTDLQDSRQNSSKKRRQGRKMSPGKNAV